MLELFAVITSPSAWVEIKPAAEARVRIQYQIMERVSFTSVTVLAWRVARRQLRFKVWQYCIRRVGRSA